MPKFLLRFERDALVKGTVEVEADSLEEARRKGEREYDLRDDIEWDWQTPALLDETTFVSATPR